MSYTFLLERGEESSAGCFSGIPASVLSRLSLTAGECSCNGNGTASCPSSPSGTTCEPSTASHGGERLTLCAGDFRAKESALPAVGPGLPTRSQACGASRLESLATYDRDTSSWRTRQCSLFEAGFELLETLPRWGMTAAGELYPLRTPSGLLELRAWITNALESGSWQRFETPTAVDTSERQPSKTVVFTKTGRARHVNKEGIQSQQSLSQQVKRMATRLPTMTSFDASCGDLAGKEYTGKNKHAEKLIQAIKRLPTPTPTTQDAKNNGSASQLDRDALNVTVGGALNPAWVEWLMGWPTRWTGLEPLGMDKFRQWSSSH